MEHFVHSQDSSAANSTLVAKIVAYIENVHQPVDNNVIVVETDVLDYGPRPPSMPHGAVIALPPMFPPHMLLSVLYEDGGIDLLTLMQEALRKAEREPKSKKHPKRLRQLAQEFSELVKCSLMNMLARHAAMSGGFAPEFDHSYNA